MLRNPRIGIFPAIVILSAGALPARAVDGPPARMLTARTTRLYLQERGSLAADEPIPSLTVLRVDAGRHDLVDASGAVYRPVRTAAGRSEWVREADVVPLPELPLSLVSLPPLIARQPASLQRAWVAVDGLIRENRALRVPLPQPYLARAEIWAKASNYEEAVRDMMTAWQLSQQRGASAADQARLMGRFQEFLQQLARTPRPRYRGDAESHYRAGFEAYHQGQLEVALRHFDEAVQLAPEDKVIWYYRALTNKRLNHEAEAERDIVIAVFQERSALGDQPRWWLGQFTRVQGPLRLWMESYRSGLAAAG